MTNILDTEIPDIAVNVLRPTKYKPEPKKVETNMTSWSIQRPVASIQRSKKMKDKVMSLFGQTPDYEVTPIRRLLNNTVSHHEVLPRDETISPQDFLREIRQTVISFIRERSENKIRLELVCEMVMLNPVTREVAETVESSFRTRQESVYESTDLGDLYGRMTAKMLESFSAYLKKGSGWMFKIILRLKITLSENKPVRGSSYIPLPKGLKTRSFINVKNKKDNHCFKWAILRHIHPEEKDPQLIGNLKKHVDELNWDEIEFPTPCSEKM